MNPEALSKIMKFIELETGRQRYADIQITLRVHDGRVSLIEQSVSQKIKPTEIIGDRDDHRM